MSVTPVSELAGRWQEHGRIRIGVKTANAMKAIDTFRFTSPDVEAIEQLAEIYGGTTMPWSDPKANPNEQWQVITRADTIRVFVLPGGLSIWYEQWSGGGILRRCDGEECQVLSAGPEGSEPTVTPCICRVQGRVVCKPKTRLNVILPEINLGGVWRLETGSWNAAHEMPAMESLLNTIQASGLLEGVLKVVKASKVVNGKKRHYVVPRLSLATNALALAAGAGGLASIPAQSVQMPALPPATSSSTLDFDLDDEVVDAELVDESAAASAVGGSGVTTSGSHPASPYDGSVADPGNPNARGEGSVPSSRNLTQRRQTRLVLTVKQAADKAGMDDTFLRHALARKVSEGKVDSSVALSPAQQSQVIDLASEIADGDWLCIVRGEEPPWVMLERP